jgi:Uma2 family endonuclease
MLVWRDDRYTETPTAADVLLVVEVASSSVELDRDLKIPMYARAGVPEAWLVDLEFDTVEVHLQPSSAGYATVSVYRPGDVVFPSAFDDVAVPVSEVLGGH